MRRETKAGIKSGGCWAVRCRPRWSVLRLWPIAIVAVVGSLVLSFVGCVKSKRSDFVVVYTSQDQVYAEPILNEFASQTGIKVRAVYDSEAVKTVGLANAVFIPRPTYFSIRMLLLEYTTGRFAGGTMARTGFVVACAAVLVLLAAGASAQVNDVSAGLGRTFLSDQGVKGIIAKDTNIHFGDGISYSLSYGRRIVDAGFASMTIEVPFVHDPSADINFATNIVPKSFSAFYLTPSIRINLAPHFAFSPWISGGGGFAHFSPSSTLVFGGPSSAKSTTTGRFKLG